MKIRKIFESMTDPDDMFEIFKDIVDDVLLTEFDKELDYEFKKGQIEVKYDGEIYLNPGDDVQEICFDDNWGFQFTMPDRREDKKRIQQRIVSLFERQTGTKLGFCELGISGSDYIGYRNPIVKVLFSKPEWIEWSRNLRDFEEYSNEVDVLLPEKFQDIKVISDFYYHKMSNRSFNFIFVPQVSMGLKVEFQRSTLLDELEIKDGEMEYDVFYYPCCYYGGTWMQLTAGMDKIEIKSDHFDFSTLNRNFVKIDEIKKNQLIKAASELNSTAKIFKVDLDEDQDENMDKFIQFLSEMVLPKIQNNISELISNIEDQIEKIEKEDNIIVNSEIISRYTKDDINYIVWLCETDYKGEHFIFKFTLNVNKAQIIIHSNKDENYDGPELFKCPVGELSDCIFLCLVDNKLVSQ